ncbi:unnamed protein product [Ambrosiozyma monospora]|uniref:Unnamed protein product n=1 Tax=Ambrosiozyma monospora TaxID=43982 RepID=A0ACB5SRG6_AMBMO|nr:unnamed protein product [Ambrosiozyma monospora]
MTSSNTVSKGAVTSNILTTTGHLEADIQKLVNCGAQALIFDYANEPERFISYIETHGNESFVTRFVDIVNGSLVNISIAKSPKEFQRVNANFYNFNLSCLWKDRIRCLITWDIAISKSSQICQLPIEMFSFGYGNYVNYISGTSTTTDSNGSESTTVFMTTTTGLDRYGSSLALPTSICENCDSESWGVTQVTLTDDSTAGGALDPMALNDLGDEKMVVLG